MNFSTYFGGSDAAKSLYLQEGTALARVKPIIKRVAKRTRPVGRNVRDPRGAAVNRMVATDNFAKAVQTAESSLPISASRKQRSLARRSSPKVASARRSMRIAQSNEARVHAGRRSKLKKARITTPR